MKIIDETSQFGFVLSIIYLLFVIINFMIKVYGRFKLGNETKFTMKNIEKLLLLASVSYIITYII